MAEACSEPPGTGFETPSVGAGGTGGGLQHGPPGAIAVGMSTDNATELGVSDATCRNKSALADVEALLQHPLGGGVGRQVRQLTNSAPWRLQPSGSASMSSRAGTDSMFAPNASGASSKVERVTASASGLLHTPSPTPPGPSGWTLTTGGLSSSSTLRPFPAAAAASTPMPPPLLPLSASASSPAGLPPGGPFARSSCAAAAALEAANTPTGGEGGAGGNTQCDAGSAVRAAGGPSWSPSDPLPMPALLPLPLPTRRSQPHKRQHGGQAEQHRSRAQTHVSSLIPPSPPAAGAAVGSSSASRGVASLLAAASVAAPLASAAGSPSAGAVRSKGVLSPKVPVIMPRQFAERVMDPGIILKHGITVHVRRVGPLPPGAAAATAPASRHGPGAADGAAGSGQLHASGGDGSAARDRAMHAEAGGPAGGAPGGAADGAGGGGDGGGGDGQEAAADLVLPAQVEQFFHAQGYSQYRVLGLKEVSCGYQNWRIETWEALDSRSVRLTICAPSQAAKAAAPAPMQSLPALPALPAQRSHRSGATAADALATVQSAPQRLVSHDAGCLGDGGGGAGGGKRVGARQLHATDAVKREAAPGCRAEVAVTEQHGNGGGGTLAAVQRAAQAGLGRGGGSAYLSALAEAAAAAAEQPADAQGPGTKRGIARRRSNGCGSVGGDGAAAAKLSMTAHAAGSGHVTAPPDAGCAVGSPAHSDGWGGGAGRLWDADGAGHRARPEASRGAAGAATTAPLTGVKRGHDEVGDVSDDYGGGPQPDGTTGAIRVPHEGPAAPAARARRGGKSPGGWRDGGGAFGFGGYSSLPPDDVPPILPGALASSPHPCRKGGATVLSPEHFIHLPRLFFQDHFDTAAVLAGGLRIQVQAGAALDPEVSSVHVASYQNHTGYRYYRLLGFKDVPRRYAGWRVAAWDKVAPDMVRVRLSPPLGPQGAATATAVSTPAAAGDAATAGGTRTSGAPSSGTREGGAAPAARGVFQPAAGGGGGASLGPLGRRAGPGPARATMHRGAGTQREPPPVLSASHPVGDGTGVGYASCDAQPGADAELEADEEALQQAGLAMMGLGREVRGQARRRRRRRRSDASGGTADPGDTSEAEASMGHAVGDDGCDVGVGGGGGGGADRLPRPLLGVLAGSPVNSAGAASAYASASSGRLPWRTFRPATGTALQVAHVHGRSGDLDGKHAAVRAESDAHAGGDGDNTGAAHSGFRRRGGEKPHGTRAPGRGLGLGRGDGDTAGDGGAPPRPRAPGAGEVRRVIEAGVAAAAARLGIPAARVRSAVSQNPSVLRPDKGRVYLQKPFVEGSLALAATPLPVQVLINAGGRLDAGSYPTKVTLSSSGAAGKAEYLLRLTAPMKAAHTGQLIVGWSALGSQQLLMHLAPPIPMEARDGGERGGGSREGGRGGGGGGAAGPAGGDAGGAGREVDTGGVPLAAALAAARARARGPAASAALQDHAGAGSDGGCEEDEQQGTDHEDGREALVGRGNTGFHGLADSVAPPQLRRHVIRSQLLGVGARRSAAPPSLGPAAEGTHGRVVARSSDDSDGGDAVCSSDDAAAVGNAEGRSGSMWPLRTPEHLIPRRRRSPNGHRRRSGVWAHPCGPLEGSRLRAVDGRNAGSEGGPAGEGNSQRSSDGDSSGSGSEGTGRVRPTRIPRKPSLADSVLAAAEQLLLLSGPAPQPGIPPEQEPVHGEESEREREGQEAHAAREHAPVSRVRPFRRRDNRGWGAPDKDKGNADGLRSARPSLDNDAVAAVPPKTEPQGEAAWGEGRYPGWGGRAAPAPGVGDGWAFSRRRATALAAMRGALLAAPPGGLPRRQLVPPQLRGPPPHGWALQRAALLGAGRPDVGPGGPGGTSGHHHPTPAGGVEGSHAAPAPVLPVPLRRRQPQLMHVWPPALYAAGVGARGGPTLPTAAAAAAAGVPTTSRDVRDATEAFRSAVAAYTAAHESDATAATAPAAVAAPTAAATAAAVATAAAAAAATAAARPQRSSMEGADGHQSSDARPLSPTHFPPPPPIAGAGARRASLGGNAPSKELAPSGAAERARSSAAQPSSGASSKRPAAVAFPVGSAPLDDHGAPASDAGDGAHPSQRQCRRDVSPRPLQAPATGLDLASARGQPKEESAGGAKLKSEASAQHYAGVGGSHAGIRPLPFPGGMWPFPPVPYLPPPLPLPVAAMGVGMGASMGMGLPVHFAGMGMGVPVHPGFLAHARSARRHLQPPIQLPAQAPMSIPVQQQRQPKGEPRASEGQRAAAAAAGKDPATGEEANAVVSAVAVKEPARQRRGTVQQQEQQQQQQPLAATPHATASADAVHRRSASALGLPQPANGSSIPNTQQQQQPKRQAVSATAPFLSQPHNLLAGLPSPLSSPPDPLQPAPQGRVTDEAQRKAEGSNAGAAEERQPASHNVLASHDRQAPLPVMATRAGPARTAHDRGAASPPQPLGMGPLMQHLQMQQQLQQQQLQARHDPAPQLLRAMQLKQQLHQVHARTAGQERHRAQVPPDTVAGAAAAGAVERAGALGGGVGGFGPALQHLVAQSRLQQQAVVELVAAAMAQPRGGGQAAGPSAGYPGPAQDTLGTGARGYNTGGV